MVSIRDIEQLPRVSGLYLVLNGNGEVIYIGQATNIRERWRVGHHRLSDIVSCYGTNVEITWVGIPQHRLNHAEYLAVKFYQPSLNRRIPPIV